MQSFKQRYLMLYASPFSIEQKDKDGTVIGVNEGVTAHFVFDDNLTSRIDEEAAAKGQEAHGIKATKMTMPHKTNAKIRNVPGFYDCTIKMVNETVTKYGQRVEVPTMKIMDIDFVGAVEAKVKPVTVEAKVA